jgi:hypothetical protein
MIEGRPPPGAPEVARVSRPKPLPAVSAFRIWCRHKEIEGAAPSLEIYLNFSKLLHRSGFATSNRLSSISLISVDCIAPSRQSVTRIVVTFLVGKVFSDTRRLRVAV